MFVDVIKITFHCAHSIQLTINLFCSHIFLTSELEYLSLLLWAREET